MKTTSKFKIGQLVEFISDPFEKKTTWVPGIVINVDRGTYAIESYKGDCTAFRPAVAVRACLETVEYRDLAEGLTDEDLMAL